MNIQRPSCEFLTLPSRVSFNFLYKKINIIIENVYIRRKCDYSIASETAAMMFYI